MSIRRRAALLDFARQRNAVIIEDDYDGKFRYDGTPLAALRSASSDDVVFYVARGDEGGAHRWITRVFDGNGRRPRGDENTGQKVEGLLRSGSDQYVIGLAHDGASDTEVLGNRSPQREMTLVALRTSESSGLDLHSSQLLYADPAENCEREQS